MIDTHAYKTKLEAQLTELTAELSTLGVHDLEADDWITTPSQPQTGEPDANEAADAVEDWNERRALLSNLETRYNNLKRALTKIEAGTFGTCEVCGEDIATARLDANPAARTCQLHLDEEANLPLR